MYCTKCGNKIPEGKEYCGKCGKHILKKPKKSSSTKIIIFSIIVIAFIITSTLIVLSITKSKENTNGNGERSIASEISHTAENSVEEPEEVLVIDSMTPLRVDELEKGIYIKHGDVFYPVANGGLGGDIYYYLISDNIQGIPEFRYGDQLVYKYNTYFDTSYVAPVTDTVYSIAAWLREGWDTGDIYLDRIDSDSVLSAHITQLMIKNWLYELHPDEINGMIVDDFIDSDQVVPIGRNVYLIKSERNGRVILGIKIGTEFQEISVEADTVFHLIDEDYMDKYKVFCSETRDGYAVINFNDFNSGGLYIINAGDGSSPEGLINVISNNEAMSNNNTSSNLGYDDSNDIQNGGLIGDWEISATSYLIPEYDDNGPYDVSQLYDGSEHTCWIPGTSRNGVGEEIFITSRDGSEQIINAIVIFAGYGKSDQSYYCNLRAKTVKISIDGADYGLFTLDDIQEYQHIMLPHNTSGETIRIEFIDYYPSTNYKGHRAWNDLCISEVSVY